MHVTHWGCYLSCGYTVCHVYTAAVTFTHMTSLLLKNQAHIFKKKTIILLLVYHYQLLSNPVSFFHVPFELNKEGNQIY